MAVIKSLQKENENIDIIFIGSRFGLESQLIPKLGIKFYGISTGKFRRYHKSTILNLIDPTTLFANIRDFFRFLSGIREARHILHYEKPDVVFAKGGYVSLPVGFAARLTRTPLVIHESDTVMGMSNRRMSHFADKVAVTFPAKFYPGIDAERLVETGSPVRDDLMMASREDALRELGFSKDKKTLMVIGGSQGALFINETILEIIDNILENFQLIWVAGDRDMSFIDFKLNEISEEKKKNLKLFGFVTSELAGLYAVADLVICRPGSNILFELAALGKPAILIPPSAGIAGGHQFENARYFSRNGGTLVINQPEVTGKKLYQHIARLLADDHELAYMSEKMRSLAASDASEKIANLILETGREHFEQARKAKTE